MRPMLPKIRKTRLPKRKASSNAVPRGLRSPRTCFFAPVSPHLSHAVILHGYPRLSRCFLTLPCRFPAPFALFSHTAVPISHSVTHGFLAPPRIDSSYRPRTFPRTVPTRPFCARFWPPHLWPLPPSARHPAPLLARSSHVLLQLRACSTDYAV